MSKEVEATVLNSLVTDRYLLTRVTGDGFSAEAFSDLNYRIIFKSVTEMTQMPDYVIDWITVEDYLKRQGRLTPEVTQAMKTAGSRILPKPIN